MAKLTVSEIYKSLQGETSHAGRPCVFIRLTACDLRCSYCDTEYAFSGGERISIGEIVSQACALGPRLVVVTGGEPLLQADVHELMSSLADRGLNVLLETSGAHPIDRVDPRVTIILDVKCPSSGETGRNLPENIEALKDIDELKFVIATEEDYDWAVSMIRRQGLAGRRILFSWAFPAPESGQLKPLPADHHPLSLAELADRVVRDNLEVRLIPQLHKIIWPHAKTAR